jgi:(4-alkanoyl-5-oxo-2,5-dihydrofuran-3-yl)methyl phosphate reductase
MILVSGATGNVGQGLVKRLVASGEQVRVFVRDERKVAHLGNSVECVVGDLDKPETLVRAMQGVEKLYFVTPETQQVKNLLDTARSARVRFIVKQSTIEADRSLGPGRWHREQEKMLEEYGFDWCFLRPTMMMVNTIEWWSDSIKKQSAVYFPGGKGKVPPVDPDDVAAAACTVLTKPDHEGKVYQLTGPQALTIREMVRILSHILGKPIRYVNVPALAAKIWMRQSGLPGYVVDGLVETLGALRRNEYAYVTDDVERLKGSKPRTYEQWVRDNIEAFR